MIEIDDISFRWRPTDAPVIDIGALSVGKGERVFIEGPSGSGKTTLLNLLGGVVLPERGTIRIAGSDITSLSGAQRDRFRADHIGFIFQMFNLIPYLSVIDNVTLPCKFSHKRAQSALASSTTLEDEARRLLAHMRLDAGALGERPAVELSTGQQQRIAVARSLIGAPDVVIADEPTSALDTDARQSFMALLFEEVRASGATLLFVSHDRQLQQGFDRTLKLAEVNHGETS